MHEIVNFSLVVASPFSRICRAACSESGYTDSKISLEWLKRIFDPETKERTNGKPRVLICDGFGTHETLEVLEYCFENNIILCHLPSHTSHKLQPCDVAVFAPLKAAYRDQVDRLERAGTNTIGKEHFTSLYSPASTPSRGYWWRWWRKGINILHLMKCGSNQPRKWKV
jgi:hypothetical protein